MPPQAAFQLSETQWADTVTQVTQYTAEKSTDPNARLATLEPRSIYRNSRKLLLLPP